MLTSEWFARQIETYMRTNMRMTAKIGKARFLRKDAVCRSRRPTDDTHWTPRSKKFQHFCKQGTRLSCALTCFFQRFDGVLLKFIEATITSRVSGSGNQKFLAPRPPETSLEMSTPCSCENGNGTPIRC